MKRPLIFVIAFFFLIFPIWIFAQQQGTSPQTGYMVLMQHICSQENLQKMSAMYDSIFVPEMNKLVDEGKLLGYGLLEHAWGDEWNYNFYFLAKSHTDFLTFYDEMIQRLNKNYPGWGTKYSALFTDHKDNMYHVRYLKTLNSPIKSGFFVVNLNKCVRPNFSKIKAMWNSLFEPVLKEFIDEGKLMNCGMLEHDWGDEWNRNFFFLVKDHRSFLDFWDEFIQRLNTRQPGWGEEFGALIYMHKDNFYTVRFMH